jgi:hypothetical protein
MEGPLRTALAAAADHARRVRRLCLVLGLGAVLAGVVPATATAPLALHVEREKAWSQPLPSLAAAIARSVPGFLDDDNAQVGRLFKLPEIGPGEGQALAGWEENEGEPADEAATAAEEPDDGLLRFGPVAIRRSLAGQVLEAARITDTDPVYLMALADKESSFQPAVRASTSSAEGLFQFIEATWLEIIRDAGPRHGLVAEAKAIETAGDKAVVPDPEMRARILELRRDPHVAALMACELMKRYRAEVGFRLGRDLTPGELYLAHFMGPNDAARLLELMSNAPKKPAASLFPAAAKANKPIFFERKGRRLRPLPVADVFARIDRSMQSRLTRYTAVETGKSIATAVAGPS